MHSLKGHSILITGGAGFIGANLAEALSKSNRVRVIDNLSTGNLDNLSVARQNGCEWLEGDIRDFDLCRRAMQGIDYVLHQAALGSVPRSIDDPLNTHAVNTTGFLNVLLAARESRVKRIVYASSSSVYGDHPGLPKFEGELGQPLSPYAVSKRCGEMYAQCFAQLYAGMQLIGLRYFNVFGKYQNPDGAYAAAVPKFIKAFIEHRSPVVYGDGEQSRDFTYVQNVVEANICALSAKLPTSFHGVYNVACEERYTLNALLTSIQQALGRYDAQIADIAIEYGQARRGDVKHSLASTEAIRMELGYQGKWKLQAGLDASIEWYWNHLKTALA